MPKDTIDRAIKRGTGELAGAAVEEVLYEAIGPSGVGIIIEAATDNKNRTAPEVKNILTKAGAKLASPGAVSYHFQKQGKIIVKSDGKTAEEIELAAIDSGAEDFEEEADGLAVYTKSNELKTVKENLESAGLTIKSAELSWEPKDIIEINDEAEAQKIVNLLEALEELDDVTGVFSSFNIKEELIEDSRN
jgi:YebC/PmpR family DNA-binding regulatory protein